MPDIHPTAVISRDARIADDVHIGPYCIVDGPVSIGAGTRLHAQAQILGPVTIGCRNVIHGSAIIGGTPQDRKFSDDFSEVILGDDNVIREGVTIHRGTGSNTKTVIGSRCYFMVNSHVGHNCRVADDVMLVNGSLLAGHVSIGERAIIGGNCAIHQFCRVGRLAMLSNIGGHNVDIPPFFIAMSTNKFTQLNLVGLRRAGVPTQNISALRRLFQILRQTRLTRATYDRIPAELLAVPEIREWREFCLESKRGVAVFEAWSQRGHGGNSDSEG